MAIPNAHTGTFMMPAGVIQTAQTNQLITPSDPTLTATGDAAAPWYKTPLGIGAIAIGALLLFRHFGKGK